MNMGLQETVIKVVVEARAISQDGQDGIHYPGQIGNKTMKNNGFPDSTKMRSCRLLNTVPNKEWILVSQDRDFFLLFKM